MTSLLSAELVATCNALGYYNPQENKYYADGNTLETVKDLIRYLRRDDETFDIRRQLGETKVVQTDLLPLLKSYWQEEDLFDVLLRLLVNLTSPALMLWQEELPNEKTARNQYLQIEEHLRLYKQAFADEAVWAVLSTRISKILELEPLERGDENGLIIERILILIRNVLYVPADPDAEKRPDNDANVHDQVLWSLHQSGILDIILYMTSSINEQAYYMHILEILSYMLREQSATELASAALQRSHTEKLRDEAELLAIRYRESNQKQRKVKMYNSTRHSRFGGTFVVKSMKSITDNELIYHKPLNKLEALNLGDEKTKSKTPKNRLPVQSETVERRSAFSIRLFLKEFCVEFLNGAYNTLMYHVKNRLARARAQQHDESYYLWALRFFMEFNRCYKFEVKLVSETMSVQSFHYVQQQMEKYFDMMSTDKKKLKQWSRRLHLALLSYRELLLTISAMDKSPDGTIKDSAKVIKSNVFYVLEYRELILTLLVTYDELKMSQLYLKDLLETQHVFLKMLESFCGGKESYVMVEAKKKARKKKRAASAPQRAAPEFNLERMWDEASPQLSVVLEGNLEIPSDVVPFDAGSDVPIDDQKSEAMKNIQRKLRRFEFENAIGLLRASREVWPENDCFGSADMTLHEEFLALQDIFSADLGENKPPPQVAVEPEDQYDEDEEDELEESFRINESDLKFVDFSKRLAHPKIVRACGIALTNFEKNSALTNHCIIKLLHRIAFDCKIPGMVFQVSIFMTFLKIYEAENCPQYEELVKFATYILRQFFKLVQTNHSVYMEALFWKSSRDAFEIEEGYGSYKERSAAASKAWTELEEDELRRLFMEHQENQLQGDVVDWIVNNLIDNTRTRRAVLKKLKEMFLLVDYKGKRKQGISGKVPKQWGTEEETQLRELYEQFKEAMDPLTCIIDRLDVHRPKNRIVEKLLVMGLVQDKKELRKKRARKSGPGSGPSRNSDGDDSECSDASDREASGRQNYGPNPASRKSQKTKPKNGKSSAHVRVSSGDLAKMLISLVDGDQSDALEWVMESFQDTAEDLENDPDDNDEGVPLVPILDCALSAMENPEFLKLLRALGVKEPSDEQETYWRIPSSVTASNLREHCGLISKAISKTLTVPEEQPPPLVINNQNESSDDDVFDKLRKITNKPEEGLVQTRKSPNKPSEMKTKRDKILSALKAFPKSTMSDVELVVEKKITKGKKRRIQVAESSDEEEVERPQEANNDEFGSFKPTRIEDSDSEPETQTIRNILDSDSDEDNPEPKAFKSMRVIASDDEDESQLQKKLIVESEDSNDIVQSKHKSKALFDSDDDSNDVNQQNENQPSNFSQTASASDTPKEIVGDVLIEKEQNKVTRRSKIFESDEESESFETAADTIEDGSKRIRSISDSDSEKPKPKRTRITDDEDEGDSQVQNNVIAESDHSNDVHQQDISESQQSNFTLGDIRKQTVGDVMEMDKNDGKKVTRKSKISVMFESDEEKENLENAADRIEEDVSKRIRSISDSDSEKPKPKRSRIIDSDED